MKKSTILVKALAALAVLAFCCAAFAAEPVTLSIKDMPVKTVISLLTEQSGVNVVMANDADMDKTITINLTDYDLESAINVIAEASGLNYKKLADGTYVIGGAAATASAGLISPEALIGTPAEPADEAVTEDAGEENTFQMIELVNTDATDTMLLEIEDDASFLNRHRTIATDVGTRCGLNVA